MINKENIAVGVIDEEHIFSKIILSVAKKLDVPVSKINKNTPIHGLIRQDYIDMISNVYKMYEIDLQKQIPFIEQDVDRLIEKKGETWFNCDFIILKICHHFENFIIGDFKNPGNIYIEYRDKIAMILQSPDFNVLHHIIETTYPSLIGLNANQVIKKELLFNEILTIPEKHLAHNYPVDQVGLFICFVSVAIAHYKFTHLEEKAEKFLEGAIEFNTKWGPFIEPTILENIKNNTTNNKFTDKTKSGCFIATAVYGDENDVNVLILKSFRDDVMLSTYIGKQLMKLYYSISPSIARFIENKINLQRFIRIYIINPIVVLIKKVISR